MRSVVVALALSVTASAAAVGPAPQVYGVREHVLVYGRRPIEVTARLNPDAAQAELAVESMKYVARGDGTWVRFVVDSGDVVSMQQAMFDLPLVRDHERRLRNGGIEHRPTVRLDICVGTRRMEVPFMLVHRQTYAPAMTLGAPQLARLGSVDASRSYTREPDCAAIARTTG